MNLKRAVDPRKSALSALQSSKLFRSREDFLTTDGTDDTDWEGDSCFPLSVLSVQSVVKTFLVAAPLLCALCVLLRLINCRITMKRLAFLLLGAVSLSLSAVEPASLTLTKTFPLNGVKGRIDHLAIDAKGRRLFVAALGNDTVEILDLDKG